MTPRQQERMKSILVSAVVLLYFVWALGWRWTLALVLAFAVVWYVAYQRPIRRMVKQAKREVGK